MIVKKMNRERDLTVTPVVIVEVGSLALAMSGPENPDPGTEVTDRHEAIDQGILRI